MINKRRSFITGIKSTNLNKKEISFLKKYKPWGIIIFSRNIKSLTQVKRLTDHIKKIFKDKNYPILIDQEGGRVNRFKNLFNAELLTSEYFAKLYNNDRKKFDYQYKIFIKSTSDLLKLSGININTSPVLDLRIKGSNNIIGDRAFSNNPHIVSKIGNICIKNFHNNNIGTTIKHIPGHGAAKVDSHKFTPLVKKSFNKLKLNDFFAFKNKNSFLAMTAHIVYESIDQLNVATHSKKIINLIRNEIKFKNIIVSDDLSMKGLKYSIKINTIKSFDAGCNLVLHCNGKYGEMIDVANNSPFLSKFVVKKTSQFYKFLSYY
jgi:beta-N-acetylhexosaminidase